MTGPYVAEFCEVTKLFPIRWWSRHSLRAVDGANLRIEPGQVLVLLGPNRAGKTTLVKMLLSLSKVTSGKVFRFGTPIADRGTLARIGYVHENHAFPRYLSARALLEYYGALSLLAESVVRQRSALLLEKVGLADRAEEPIAHFSKGMVQRLGLAQALMNDPDLLVLDEPSEGLDLNGRQMIFDVVAEQRRQGRTVLLITHVLADVERVADQIAVMVAGKIVFRGTLESVTHGGKRTLEEAMKELYEHGN